MPEGTGGRAVTDTEKQELDRIEERRSAWVRSMSLHEKVQLLKDIGILDVSGQLSSRYGGDGEDTSDERPSAH